MGFFFEGLTPPPSQAVFIQNAFFLAWHWGKRSLCSTVLTQGAASTRLRRRARSSLQLLPASGARAQHHREGISGSSTSQFASLTHPTKQASVTAANRLSAHVLRGANSLETEALFTLLPSANAALQTACPLAPPRRTFQFIKQTSA